MELLTVIMWVLAIASYTYNFEIFKWWVILLLWFVLCYLFHLAITREEDN